MSESKLRDLSMDFSISIINLVKELKAKHESVISNQIGRSGTSIGANIIVYFCTGIMWCYVVYFQHKGVSL